MKTGSYVFYSWPTHGERQILYFQGFYHADEATREQAIKEQARVLADKHGHQVYVAFLVGYTKPAQRQEDWQP